MSESESNKKEVPEEFSRVIKDFVNDIKITFPEYLPIINKWWKDASNFDYIEEEEEKNKAIQQSEKTSTGILFSFCQKKYPVKFFEILYQNEDIFKEDSTTDTEFLPHIHFKDLWQFDITEKTRETIWKYLQLILFSIINTIDNKEAFGDSAKLFEAINEGDFKNKLEETMTKMQEIFNMNSSSEKQSADDDDDDDDIKGGAGGNFGANLNMDDLPNPADLHDHITGMLEGKLGKLAKEIAEETAEGLDLGIDMDGSADMKDVFNKIVKNPGKLMGLVKNVGEKLDTRIKSGELKESELIAEATELMNKMKNMPGMDGIQEMLSKMGMSGAGLGKGGKVNYGAMEAELNKKMRLAKMKERMHAKSEMNKAAKEAQQQMQEQQGSCKPAMSEEELIALFSKGEKAEKSPRAANPNNQSSVQNSNTNTTSSTKSKNNKKKGKK
jgi:hypothetical protein